MSSMTYSQKMFKPTAPEKGSFPLDHDGVCKRTMLQYMTCILSSDGDSTVCRNQARDYLQCRMNNDLMDKEEWSKLGYHETKQDAAPA